MRDAGQLRAAMTMSAAYLHVGDTRDGCFYTPEAARRARGIEVWAALRIARTKWLATMIESNCRLAARFAAGLQAAGFQILNDVVRCAHLRRSVSNWSTTEEDVDRSLSAIVRRARGL